jgi:hypothetical protein
MPAAGMNDENLGGSISVLIKYPSNCLYALRESTGNLSQDDVFRLRFEAGSSRTRVQSGTALQYVR